MNFYIENDLLIDNLSIADTWFTRLKGLMFKKNIPNNSGLLLIPCNGIHTFFMKFPIDVLYLDKDNRIIAIYSNVKPWQVLPINKQCKSVLEIKAGKLQIIEELLGKICYIES